MTHSTIPVARVGPLLLVCLAATGCYSKRWARMKDAAPLPEDTPVELFISPDLEVFALNRFQPVARMQSDLSDDVELLGRVDIEAMFLWTRDSILVDAEDYARKLGGNALLLYDVERWTGLSDPQYHFRVYRVADGGE